MNNHLTTRRLIRPTATLLVAAWVVLLADSLGAQEVPVARVAVVDVNYVISGSLHMKAFNEAYAERVKSLQVTAQEIADKVQGLQVKITVAPRSDQRPALEKEMTRLQGELAKARQLLLRQREAGTRQVALAVYRDIEAAVKDLLKERRYVLVLRMNSADERDVRKPAVMFASPRVNISRLVLDMVNLRYTSRQDKAD